MRDIRLARGELIERFLRSLVPLHFRHQRIGPWGQCGEEVQVNSNREGMGSADSDFGRIINWNRVQQTGILQIQVARHRKLVDPKLQVEECSLTWDAVDV